MAYVAIILAGLFATSGLAKLRHRRAFEEYLWPLAETRAKLLARVTLWMEGALAVVLAVGAFHAGSRLWGGVAATMFLSAATVFYILVLVRTELSTCSCFGGTSRSVPRVEQAWHPALFSLRNGILLALSVTLAGGSTAITGGVAATSIMSVGVGLTISIARHRAILGLDEHPALDDYAPTMRILQAHTWWLEGRPRPF